MYWFGEEKEELKNWLETSGDPLLSLKTRMRRTKLQDIVSVLHQLSEFWKKNGHSEEIIRGIEKDSGFSRSEVEQTLAILPALLSEESLMKRLGAEFTNENMLDRFAKLPHQETLIKAQPLGLILHITAGNVFLSSLDSLLMAMVTKNISLLKVSSENKTFPLYFARTLKKIDTNAVLSDKFAILHWKGGDQTIEAPLKKKVNAIVAWGGEEMISSMRKDLPAEVKLLDFGPKVSFQIMSRQGLSSMGLSKAAQAVVSDVIPWNQGACASPQDLFVQEGVDQNELMRALEAAFSNAPKRNALSDDEATEILKEKYRALYSELMENGKMAAGPDFLLHAEANKYLRPSPLNRSLIIKTFKDAADLADHLRPFSYYLQSASYLLSSDEKNDYLDELAAVGVKRLAPLGTITMGKDGAPHDGRFVLRELVSFVGDEIRATISTDSELTNSLDIKRAFDTLPHPPGYIFSSGGTTGEPKYVHFSYEEFDFVSDMLAKSLRAQGIKAGMKVANLFVAGNLWSSFMAVEKALEKIGAIQLPIGGMCSEDNITMYLEKFKPDVVMGIPSMLVKNAEYMNAKGKDVIISMVFYAGEALSEPRQDYLSKIWGTKYFGSVGYASVDAGVIGYQCSHSKPGEHHLFSDLIEMKVIEGEAIVSSLYRSSLPIKNYKTGDKVEMIGPCSCGDPSPRFRLLGRADNLMMIWSCRIQLDEVEKTLKALDPGILSYQVVISENKNEEILSLYYEKNQNIKEEILLANLYANARDLRDTITLEEMSAKTRIIPVDHGMIPRNSRTGKISLILDKRHT
jgi:phenylacetate-coenzyme A ligase PaaK-like adenylate-forming protein